MVCHVTRRTRIKACLCPFNGEKQALGLSGDDGQKVPIKNMSKTEAGDIPREQTRKSGLAGKHGSQTPMRMPGLPCQASTSPIP